MLLLFPFGAQMSDCLSARLSLATEINIKHFVKIRVFRLTSRHTRFLYFCLRFELRTMHVISFVCVLQFWMLFVLYAHLCYKCVCLCVYLGFFFFQMKYVLIYGSSAYIINSCILQALGRLHQDMLYNNENKESADRRTRRREDSQEEWKYARNRWERKEQQIEGY